MACFYTCLWGLYNFYGAGILEVVMTSLLWVDGALFGSSFESKRQINKTIFFI